MPHSLNCNYHCDCRWKSVFKTVLTSAEAPSRRCSWCPPRPSRNGSVESAKLLLAAKASVEIKNNDGWWPQPSLFLISSEAFIAPGWRQHGRPHGDRRLSPGEGRGRSLLQEKFDNRRVIGKCCRVQCRHAARPPDHEELVHAALVAAQVAPHCRQVAGARRPSDVGVSARGEMQQKYVLSYLDLYCMFYLL